jgi:hypothetical protein
MQNNNTQKFQGVDGGTGSQQEVEIPNQQSDANPQGNANQKKEMTQEEKIRSVFGTVPPKTSKQSGRRPAGRSINSRLQQENNDIPNNEGH